MLINKIKLKLIHNIVFFMFIIMKKLYRIIENFVLCLFVDFGTDMS